MCSCQTLLVELPTDQSFTLEQFVMLQEKTTKVFLLLLLLFFLAISYYFLHCGVPPLLLSFGDSSRRQTLTGMLDGRHCCWRSHALCAIRC